jgi:hypothetical protein
LDLAEAHKEHFELDEPLDPDEFNNDQRLVIIASDIGENEDLLRMADFLQVHNIDVVAVEYSWYYDDTESSEFLITDAIRLEQEQSASSEDDLSAWKQRRAEFWKEFRNFHTEYGLSGDSSNLPSASYSIEVFSNSQRDNPPSIRPAIRNSNKAYVEIRFYDKEFVHDEDNKTAFENAVAEAIKKRNVDLSPSIRDELVWDTEKERTFEKVRIDYESFGSLDHANFTDKDELGDVQEWFVEIAQVYQSALEKMESTGRIQV